MYYQKESENINNDYYDIYAKYSNKKSDRNTLLTTIIKILAIIFLLISIIFGYIFLSNQYYLSQIQAQKLEQSKKRSYLRDVEQVIEIEARKSSGGLEKEKLSQEEITQIVQMVMLKMKKGEEDNTYKTPIKEDRVEIQSTQQPKAIIVGTIDTTTGITTDSIEENKRDNMKVIVVKEGDTLSTIASRVYGNVSAYKKIYKANPELIKNENKIFIGQKIRLPQ